MSVGSACSTQLLAPWHMTGVGAPDRPAQYVMWYGPVADGGATWLVESRHADGSRHGPVAYSGPRDVSFESLRVWLSQNVPEDVAWTLAVEFATCSPEYL